VGSTVASEALRILEKRAGDERRHLRDGNERRIATFSTPKARDDVVGDAGPQSLPVRRSPALADDYPMLGFVPSESVYPLLRARPRGAMAVI
jgi:hypothetical protein